MKSFTSLKIYALLCILLVLVSSCVDTRKATYFNDIGNASIKPPVADLEPIIQKSDLLNIYVSSLNPDATQLFNASNSATALSASAQGQNAQSIGYLVSQDGNIQFPLLGVLHAEGLTKKQLTEDITKGLTERKLLIDPIVSIRFLNYRVTVLGEVARPTVITVANEKISLLEAIGLAGDMTVYAKRDNVLLIREENGRRLIRRIDLNSQEIFTSPFYYLKTNDIVYVEANKAKVATASRSQQWLPIMFSALSFATIVAQYIIR